MNRDPSGQEVDRRMTDAILAMKKMSLGYGYYHEEAIKLEKAQKEWRKIREEYGVKIPFANIKVNVLDEPEESEDVEEDDTS